MQLWSLFKGELEVVLHLLSVLVGHLLHPLEVVQDLAALAHLLDKLFFVSFVLIETFLEFGDQLPCLVLILSLFLQLILQDPLALLKLIAVELQITKLPTQVFVSPLSLGCLLDLGLNRSV